MEFTVKTTAEGFRRGKITVRGGEGVSEGPSFVTPMWKGNIPHSTPGITAAEGRSSDASSVRDSLAPLAVAISDVIDDKKLMELCAPGAIRKMYGAQSSAADPQHVLCLIETPPSRSKPRPLNPKHITVQGKKGAIQVTPKDIVDIALGCGVDLVLEPTVEATSDESVSRHRKCAVASLSVLDQCVAIANEAGLAGKLGFVGVVQGAATEKERTWYAGELSRRDKDLFGYSLGGFGLGESAEERNALAKVVLDRLNPAKPRWVSKVGTPMAVLDLIKLGIDYFVTDYPEVLATEGYGLVFSINCDYDGCTFGSCGEDPYKVNLDDVGLTEDNRVILPGCTCHACTEGYSRAYIYHLRNTHEMLGDILLTIHNIHHYALWFAKIRSTMDEGKFTEYCNAFAEHHSMETK